jgi:hypothetical protein
VGVGVRVCVCVCVRAVEHQILQLARDGKLREYKAEVLSLLACLLALLALLVQKYLEYLTHLAPDAKLKEYIEYPTDLT